MPDEQELLKHVSVMLGIADATRHAVHASAPPPLVEGLLNSLADALQMTDTVYGLAEVPEKRQRYLTARLAQTLLYRAGALLREWLVATVDDRTDEDLAARLEEAAFYLQFASDIDGVAPDLDDLRDSMIGLHKSHVQACDIPF